MHHFFWRKRNGAQRKHVRVFRPEIHCARFFHHPLGDIGPKTDNEPERLCELGIDFVKFQKENSRWYDEEFSALKFIQSLNLRVISFFLGVFFFLYSPQKVKKEKDTKSQTWKVCINFKYIQLFGSDNWFYVKNKF